MADTGFVFQHVRSLCRDDGGVDVYGMRDFIAHEFKGDSHFFQFAVDAFEQGFGLIAYDWR